MHRLSHGQYLNEGDTLAQSKKPWFVLMLGHSNICGADDYANSTNSNGYVMPFAPVQLRQWITAGSADPIAYTTAGVTAAAAPRAPAGQVNFGPDLSLARHLDLVRPGKWMISKWGIFGSTLAVNWAPNGTYPTSPPAGPNLYNQMLSDTLTQVAAAGAVIPFICIGLGDPDGLDNAQSAAFEANLRAFIPRLRSDLAKVVGNPNVPILLMQTPSTSPIPNVTTIRTAQQNVASSVANVTLINVDDLTPLITSYHLNANSIVTFGHRLATAGLTAMGIADAYVNPGWTTDGDGNGFPQTAAEWNAVVAAANATYGVGISNGTPFAIPDLTVASGNATDLLAGVALVASGTNGTYHAPAAGFTRLGISTTDAATFKLATADATYPDLASEDMAVLTYVRLNADTGTFRNLTNMGLAAGVRYKAAMKAAGLPNIFDGNTNNTSGTKKPAGAVRPMYAQHLVSNSSVMWADDLEVLTVTFDATVAGKGLEIIGGANAAPNAVTLYAAVFRGVNARWTQAQLRAVLKVLRWQPQW